MSFPQSGLDSLYYGGGGIQEGDSPYLSGLTLGTDETKTDDIVLTIRNENAEDVTFTSGQFANLLQDFADPDGSSNISHLTCNHLTVNQSLTTDGDFKANDDVTFTQHFTCSGTSTFGAIDKTTTFLGPIQADDNVTVAAAKTLSCGTLTASGDVTVAAAKTLSCGTLTASGNVTVAEAKTLTCGTLTASGTITASNGLSVATNKNLTVGTGITLNGTTGAIGTSGVISGDVSIAATRSFNCNANATFGTTGSGKTVTFNIPVALNDNLTIASGKTISLSDADGGNILTMTNASSTAVDSFLRFLNPSVKTGTPATNVVVNGCVIGSNSSGHLEINNKDSNIIRFKANDTTIMDVASSGVTIASGKTLTVDGVEVKSKLDTLTNDLTSTDADVTALNLEVDALSAGLGYLCVGLGLTGTVSLVEGLTLLTTFATRAWVTEKNYLTSSSLDGYATQAWVTSNAITAGGTLTTTSGGNLLTLTNSSPTTSPVDTSLRFLNSSLASVVNGCLIGSGNDGAFEINNKDSLPLRLRTNGTVRLTLGGGGAVNFSGVSHTISTATGGDVLTLTNSATTSSPAGTVLKFNNPSTGISTLGAIIGLNFAGDFEINNKDAKGLFLNTSNQTRLFINSSGNVGIGTQSPAQKLDVAGTGNFTALTIATKAVATQEWVTGNAVVGGGTLTTASGGNVLTLTNSSPTTTAVGSFLRFLNPSLTTVTNGSVIGSNSSGVLEINNKDALGLSFKTGDVERMTIAGNGYTMFNHTVNAGNGIVIPAGKTITIDTKPVATQEWVTANAPGAGLGTQVTGTILNNVNMNSASVHEISSIVITTGTWMITFNAQFNSNSQTATAKVDEMWIGISLTSGGMDTSGGGLVQYRYTWYAQKNDIFTAVPVTMFQVTRIIKCTSNTNVYANACLTDYSVANGTLRYNHVKGSYSLFQATRIA